ncbi:MAG: hypothetical protein K8T25_19855 [Planctomycetia bacterium]|nr:hypothetical protein [Planctomycetia bacterium]
MNEPVSAPPSGPSAAIQSPAPLPVPQRRRWWKPVLLLLVGFICGGVVGIGGTLKVIDNRVQEAIHHPERMPERLAARLTSRLSLSPKQRAEVLAILQTRQRQMLSIRHRVQPEVETVLDGVEGDISAILDPKQREKWLHDIHYLRDRFTPPMPGKE